MRIVLTTNDVFTASNLKNTIIEAIKGNITDYSIDTWSYRKAGDGFDVIFHNPSQFVDNPSKNVIFRLEQDGENVLFTGAFWTSNPQPSRELFCVHIGRLCEMLLTYFSRDILRLSVIDL